MSEQTATPAVSVVPPGSVVIPPEATWTQLQAIAKDVLEIKAAIGPFADLVARVTVLERKLWTVAGASAVLSGSGIAGFLQLFH